VKRTVLFLAANPLGKAALDLRTEYAAIAQSLKRKPKNHTLSVVPKNAVTDDDLRRALLDHEPEIVHFSGHGAGRRGLVFEEVGESLLISGDALSGLLGLFSRHVKCVLLNACYSEVQARSISSVVEYVIGMSRAIGDTAAIKFSTGFYDSLASGRSYTDAFQFGCNAISLRGIPESLTPTLFVKNRLQSDENLGSSDKFCERKATNIRQIDKTLDASIQELISVLDFRADVILSEMEEKRRQILGSGVVVSRAPTGSVRDLVPPVRKALIEFPRRFAELHEQNKNALINRQFVAAHEITRQIQAMLADTRNAITLWWDQNTAYVACGGGPGKSPMELPDACASEYPGLLPESVKTRPSEIILMWKQDGAERRRAEEESRTRAEEGTKRRLAEEAESAKRRENARVRREAAIEKGVLKEGDRCPKCGFAYGWDGLDCHHCHYHEG
jgi:CHAT domain